MMLSRKWLTLTQSLTLTEGKKPSHTYWMWAMKPTLVIEFQILQTKEQTTNDERNGMKRNDSWTEIKSSFKIIIKY